MTSTRKVKQNMKDHQKDPDMLNTTVELLTWLKGEFQTNRCWKLPVLDVIGKWPLAVEYYKGEKLTYQIGGEALNWRLLAYRIIRSVNLTHIDCKWYDWLDTPGLFAGINESEFRNSLGIEKFRASLNYFYGVSVEQSLLTVVEDEISKRGIAAGLSATDEKREDAYLFLYGGSYDDLWDMCRLQNGENFIPIDKNNNYRLTLSDDESFTYWLFKRRLKRSDPARVASDTKKGLIQLDLMGRSQHKRKKLFRTRVF